MTTVTMHPFRHTARTRADGARCRRPFPFTTESIRMNRRTLLAYLAALPLTAFAGQPYDTSSFSAAQRAGDPILVVVSADWCPTCRKQDPTVESLLKTDEFSRIRMFKVDFDNQEDVLKALSVRKQSTLILFKGNQEIARSIGETRAEAIAQMLRKAL